MANEAIPLRWNYAYWTFGWVTCLLLGQNNIEEYMVIKHGGESERVSLTDYGNINLEWWIKAISKHIATGGYDYGQYHGFQELM